MVRLVLMWVNSPWACELRPGLNKLGRNPTNDFRISDPSVSSFHAEIIVADGKIRVRDLGSTNGTFIDDVRIEEGEFKPENTLRLGNIELRLEEVPVVDTSTLQKSEALAAKPEVKHFCAYHKDSSASYWCEHCGGYFCNQCVKIAGHDRFGAMTFCPVCKGQCNHLPNTKPAQKEKSLLGRLTQTLKIPFAR